MCCAMLPPERRRPSPLGSCPAIGKASGASALTTNGGHVFVGKAATRMMSESRTINNERNMTIRRDELRKIDFSDVSSGKRLAPVHPGSVLLEDFIEPMEISRYRV